MLLLEAVSCEDEGGSGGKDALDDDLDTGGRARVVAAVEPLLLLLLLSSLPTDAAAAALPSLFFSLLTPSLFSLLPDPLCECSVPALSAAACEEVPLCEEEEAPPFMLSLPVPRLLCACAVSPLLKALFLLTMLTPPLEAALLLTPPEAVSLTALTVPFA